MNRLVGLPPVIGPQTRLLVLGSFPGVASLRAQRYYGHPQNQFWKILSALWSVDLVGMGYEDRVGAVRERGLGIWDVYGACEREGSLDSAIRNAELNDFAWLHQQCPRLEGWRTTAARVTATRYTRRLWVYRCTNCRPPARRTPAGRSTESWRPGETSSPGTRWLEPRGLTGSGSASTKKSRPGRTPWAAQSRQQKLRPRGGPWASRVPGSPRRRKSTRSLCGCRNRLASSGRCGCRDARRVWGLRA